LRDPGLSRSAPTLGYNLPTPSAYFFKLNQYLRDMSVDKRQQVLNAILLKSQFFSVEELAARTGMDLSSLLLILQSLRPYLESVSDDGSSYRVKAEYTELLRDEAGYPPRTSCEGGWGISK